ncbi:class I SAM-dependent methyltransferase [Pseudomonas sp. Marseille-QA0892]
MTDYITDIPYPHFFQRETTPVWLNFVATALGRRCPDLRQPFAVCELGCGQGFGSVLQAAANPQGHFVGVDFNAAHVEHGRKLAAAAGVLNVEFIQDTFAGMLSASGEEPQYDFIILHGVYSWVSEADRATLRAFIERQLKPDGIAFVGYMSQPGLEFFSAPRRFVQQYAKTVEGTSAERVMAGLRALQCLCRSGAGVFAHDPKIANYVDRILGDDPSYLAHELLNEHWATLPVADVIHDFEGIGTAYLGSATPIDNVNALSLPGNVLPMLADLSGIRLRETFKDLARNQTHRRDLYQRPNAAMSEAGHRVALLEQVVAALPRAPAPGNVRFDTRIGPVEGDASLFSPILDALARQPQRFSGLARTPALAGQISDISPALQTLTWAGHIHPMLPGRVDVATCQAFNRVISERVIAGERYSHLAAPSLGSGIAADFVEMAAARVLLDHPRLRGTLLRETVDAMLRRSGWKAVDNAGEPLGAQLARFEREVLPIWQQYGVVGA